MFGKEWITNYRPSYNNGSYGSFYYNKMVDFYPQQISEYIASKKDAEYIDMKFSMTLKHIAFDINSWYPLLKHYTFSTTFLNISPNIAQSIINFYRITYCGADQNRLTKQDINNLRLLHKEIDIKIKSYINKWYNNKNDITSDTNNAVFIRFSYRSPKDGAKIYKNNEIEKIMNEEIISDNHINDDDENKANLQFMIFCNKLRNNLMINNANDAMSLILSSERIFKDMLSIIAAHKYPYKYLFYHQFTRNITDKMDKKEEEEKENINNEYFEICDVQIAIRKWDKRIRDDLEFRCFVYNRNLKAISQYNEYCYFKHLANNEEYIQYIKNTISKYFEENIKCNLPNYYYINYCIDIGIITNNNNDILQCIVIELGPLEKGITGLCLFKWNQHFENQLKYGKNIEIKIKKENNLRKQFVDHWLEETNKIYSKQIKTPWYQVLDELDSKYQNKTKHNQSNHCICL